MLFFQLSPSQLVDGIKPSIKLHKEPMLTRSIASMLRQTSCGWLWNRSSNPFINNPLVIGCLEAHIRLPSAIRCAAFWKVTFFCWRPRSDSNRRVLAQTAYKTVPIDHYGTGPYLSVFFTIFSSIAFVCSFICFS